MDDRVPTEKEVQEASEWFVSHHGSGWHYNDKGEVLALALRASRAEVEALKKLVVGGGCDEGVWRGRAIRAEEEAMGLRTQIEYERNEIRVRQQLREKAESRLELAMKVVEAARGLQVSHFMNLGNQIRMNEALAAFDAANREAK